MLEQIIIGLLVVIIAMMIYFNVNNQDDKEDFNIQSIKDVQVEIKEKIIEIYNEGKMPLVYDCQSKLKENNDSSSELLYLGD